MIVAHVPDAQVVSLGELPEKIPDIENPYLALPEFVVVMLKVHDGSIVIVCTLPLP